jgi:hypothetical protein
MIHLTLGLKARESNLTVKGHNHSNVSRNVNSCSILTTLSDTSRTRMTNTYCVCTVSRYSWWWTVDISETCRLLYQINLRNSASRWLSLSECKLILIHSFDFIYNTDNLSTLRWREVWVLLQRSFSCCKLNYKMYDTFKGEAINFVICWSISSRWTVLPIKIHVNQFQYNLL